MTKRRSSSLTTLALVGCGIVTAPALVFAQNAETASGSASQSRSTNERVNTEASTPPPVNSDYRRAAEGKLPTMPGSVPNLGGGAIDPAARGPLTGNASNGAAGGGNFIAGPGMPAGFDSALLIEHALGMGIESSTLSGLVAGVNPDDAGNEAVRGLKTHAEDEMRTSKELLSKAAASGANLPGNSPVRQLYHAANNYMSTLAKLSEPGMQTAASVKAELAQINHAVVAVMDASHLSQFGGIGGSSPAMGALLAHAQSMRDEGTKTLDRIGGTNPLDPSAPLNPVMLAQRGKELVSAMDALAPMAPLGYGMGGINGGQGQPLDASQNTGQGPYPGRFQNNRPEIVGGTYGTGAQGAGTATGADAAKNVKNSTEGPAGELNVPTPGVGSGVSGYGVGNNNTPPTNSTAGSRPK